MLSGKLSNLSDIDSMRSAVGLFFLESSVLITKFNKPPSDEVNVSRNHVQFSCCSIFELWHFPACLQIV